MANEREKQKQKKQKQKKGKHVTVGLCHHLTASDIMVTNDDLIWAFRKQRKWAKNDAQMAQKGKAECLGRLHSATGKVNRDAGTGMDLAGMENGQQAV